MGGSRPDFEPMTVPNGAFAAVAGQLEILREFEAICGASIFAQAAEHAARGIVRKRGEHFPARGIVALPAHYNQIFRAGQRAKVAGDAERFARLRIDI